jgi:hypothetical protein
MEYYVLLFLSTCIIVWLALLIWMKTHDLSFQLGFMFLYFWSLYGGWSIITDNLGGDSGKRYGYLEQKMFPVYLDEHYLFSLFLYALFIIIIEFTILFLVSAKRSYITLAHTPIVISHSVILSIAVLAGLSSYLIIRPYLLEAVASNLSGYSATRWTDSPYFTLHQVLNRLALVPAVLGFSILCCKQGRLFTGRQDTKVWLSYFILLTSIFLYLFILGNKNELFGGGIVGIFLYLANSARPNYKMIAVFAFTGLMGILAIDLLRSLPITSLIVLDFESVEWSDIFKFALGSNEAFAAHFSMYGVLAYQLSPTYGTSIISLMASIVPRVFWPDRPPDIYIHYASGVHAVSDQGYSIHHATGWYLNFGVVGVILGAFILGLVWTFCYNGYLKANLATIPRWWTITQLLAPWTFVSYIPSFIRAGPEIYKGYIIEGIMIPVFVLALSASTFRFLRK